MGLEAAIADPGHFLDPLHSHPPLRVSPPSHTGTTGFCFSNQNVSPESPRWLVHEGHYEYARASVAQTNSDGDLSDPVALAVYKEILDALEWEKKEGRTMSPKEIVRTPTARRRLLIGMSAGPFSCIAGNIIASYYLGAELTTAGISDTLDQLKAVGGLLYTPPIRKTC